MFSHTYLQHFTEQVFLAMGCPEADARLAAQVLLSADLRGIDSHGIARLNGYVRLADLGRLNPKPQATIVHETPSTAVLDGDAGLGLVIAPQAMGIAIAKARLAGTGWVAVRNSNHFGIAGFHAMLALEHDMIGFVMTHAAPLVAPTFSKDKLLGTNPIAIAIPALTQPPFVMDLATTTAAYGKLEILQRKGMDTPTGWVQDADGQPATDAFAIKNGGALLPLGGDREHGSHKGYALGAWVDIFSGVLSGANYGPWVPPFATAGFMGAAAQTTGMPVNGHEKVLIPGDPERLLQAERNGAFSGSHAGRCLPPGSRIQTTNGSLDRDLPTSNPCQWACHTWVQPSFTDTTKSTDSRRPGKAVASRTPAIGHSIAAVCDR